MNDGINTLDPDSELRLTIMSGIAQDESREKLLDLNGAGHPRSRKKTFLPVTWGSVWANRPSAR